MQTFIVAEGWQANAVSSGLIILYSGIF